MVTWTTTLLNTIYKRNIKSTGTQRHTNSTDDQRLTLENRFTNLQSRKSASYGTIQTTWWPYSHYRRIIRLRRVIRWIIRVRQIIRLNLKIERSHLDGNPPDLFLPLYKCVISWSAKTLWIIGKTIILAFLKFNHSWNDNNFWSLNQSQGLLHVAPSQLLGWELLTYRWVMFRALLIQAVNQRVVGWNWLC